MGTDNKQELITNQMLTMDKEYEGIYGAYTINQNDKKEVKLYRISLLTCGSSFALGLLEWIFIGPEWAWAWIIPMTISLGLALKWIHIYLRPLHKTLQILWIIGTIGTLLMGAYLGAPTILPTLSSEPKFIWLIGPLFAALTGLGFKEFFCFQRPEAISLTLLIPLALIGHLSQLLSRTSVMTMLLTSALMMTILALRKFGMDPAADVGDKSVFEYLESQQTSNAL